MFFFGSKDGGETDQLTAQTPLPIYRYLLLIPQPGTLSLASLAMLWATCSSQGFLVTQCFEMSCQGQEGFFCHPCCKPPKPKPILFGLPCGHRTDLLPTKASEHRLPQKLLRCLPVFISFLFEGRKAITWRKACSLHRGCCKVTVAL